ncbi:MAG: flagellar biosynthetic protein FliO [Acetivibrionales bacterium]|jgi:flagellar protein FliO/FliZ|nr:flagellar biosynthetic protein FliO [Clostridiaceae bacterium]
MFFEVLGLLLAFGVILLLSYYTTRLIGKRMSGSAKNKSMKIVETLSLGVDRYLYLILVGNKHFLFYSSKKGLELVSEIDVEMQAENSGEEDEKAANISNFKRIFDTYSGLSNKRVKNSNEGNETKEPEETGILRSIKRLKQINTNDR